MCVKLSPVDGRLVFCIRIRMCFLHNSRCPHGVCQAVHCCWQACPLLLSSPLCLIIKPRLFYNATFTFQVAAGSSTPWFHSGSVPFAVRSLDLMPAWPVVSFLFTFYCRMATGFGKSIHHAPRDPPDDVACKSSRWRPVDSNSSISLL